MHKQKLDRATIRKLLSLQREEINGYHTYLRLAEQVKNPKNSRVLKHIASEEQKHYQIWKNYTQQDVAPGKSRVTLFFWLSKLLGLTFGIKLMEQGEEKIQLTYKELIDSIPEAAKVLADEEKHENELLDMLDEESLRYSGSVVLGLNDALVELTGALAGFTLAFQNTRLIALAGLITGISASFSMAASEYLSTKSEGGKQNPIKSAAYTGIAYIFTVTILIFPFLINSNYLVSLGLTIFNAILVIALFNYYISVAKGFQFKKRFLEMAGISLGVALLSFLLGNLISKWFGVSV